MGVDEGGSVLVLSEILLLSRSSFHALVRTFVVCAELLFNFTADIIHLNGDIKKLM